MRNTRLLLAVVAALAVGACARQQPTYYVVDPSTGQPAPMVTQQQFAQPQDAPQSYAQQAYAQPQYAQQTYAQPSYQQPAATPPRTAPSGGGRGLFTQSARFAAQ